MKRFQAILCLVFCLMLNDAYAESPAKSIDFVGQLRLDIASETIKTEVTVKTFVDGDTTHFLLPADGSESAVLRARYLAINTPEITGKVEEYGKKAASFTKEKLSAAESILIESDSDRWNPDSTGDRYLVWVWYRNKGESDYRCLNLELLQNGLAIANSTANNRYGSTCMAALNQAKAEKLNLYSGQKDPDFYYGQAIELTLRELRTNTAFYNGKKVAFNGVVTMNRSQSVYVEAYDAETGLYFGMPVYYGHGMSGAGLEILSVGNEVRIVGTLQYYEAGSVWQVSGLSYRMMKPDDPGNIQKLSDGHSAAYTPLDIPHFVQGQISLSVNDEIRTFSAAELALGTSVSVPEVLVESAHADEYGGLILNCTSSRFPLLVKTEPLMQGGILLQPDYFVGKSISIKGIIDFSDGNYVIRVLSPDHLNIHASY